MFTQKSDKFIFEHIIMGSDTAEESEMSLEARSFLGEKSEKFSLKKCNERTPFDVGNVHVSPSQECVHNETDFLKFWRS